MMIPNAIITRSTARYFLALFTAMNIIQPATADNTPPCQPCKVEIPLPEARQDDITSEASKPRRQGLHAFAVDVTFTANGNPQGTFLRRCWNNDGEDAARDTFDCRYVPKTNRRTFFVGPGGRKSVRSDDFELKYDNPCDGTLKTIGPVSQIAWIDSGSGGHTENPNDPHDPKEDPVPHDPPNLEDPYLEPDDTEGGSTDCNVPFVPGTCHAFDNQDTRVPTILPAPHQVEIVAENIYFTNRKRGFLQYDYDTVHPAIPKYFLVEQANTQLSGGSPETPVGGSVTRQICPMTGELIETAKQGNPSFYGVRSGPGTNVVLTETEASGSFPVDSYDDCPNQAPDTPGSLAFASALSGEYTKTTMMSGAFSYAWAFKGSEYFRQEEASASLLINASETEVNYHKLKYKVRVPATILRPYVVAWVEEFTPKDTNLEDGIYPAKEFTYKRATVTGIETAVYTIDPQLTPTKEGKWHVYLQKVNACVDYDRSMSIDFSGADHTKPSKPHRFWINDDRDLRHMVDTLPAPIGHFPGLWEEDDVDESEKPLADCDEPGLTCLRDLEDLDRILVDYTAVVARVGAYHLTIKASRP